MSDRRKLILETFEGIPSKICEAEKCCEFCPTDESLQNEVMELYIAILIAIMDMMEWLVETGGCRFSCAASYNYAMQCSWRKGKQIKALCQGPLYGKSLDQDQGC